MTNRQLLAYVNILSKRWGWGRELPKLPRELWLVSKARGKREENKILSVYLCLGSKDTELYQGKCAPYTMKHYGIDVFDPTVDVFLGEALDSNRYFENFWIKEVGF